MAFQDVVVEHRRSGGAVRAVAGVTFELRRGEILGLVGESGCGKSTLAHAGVGMIEPTSGAIRFEGETVATTRLVRRRPKSQLRLQMVFQDSSSSLNPRRRVGDQLVDSCRSLSRAKRAERAGELLESVGLPAAAGRRYPHEFSGGQRQRIAIARALSVDPSVIIADEPMASLDASSQAQIVNLLSTLCRERNVALILISHDLLLVNQIADRIAVMYLGKFVEMSDAGAFWRDQLHPYSKALVAAIPLTSHHGVLPTTLPGEVPDPANPPTGCRLRPRCGEAFERCLAEPPLLSVGTRLAACWLHDAN